MDGQKHRIEISKQILNVVVIKNNKIAGRKGLR